MPADGGIHAHPTRKLGRKAPTRDTSHLQLRRFLKKVPAAPRAVHWVPPGVRWGLMLNDAIGDCTIATCGHIIQAATGLEFGGPGHVVPDAAILDAYKAVSGYDGTDATDTGCVETDVLDYWRTHGVGGHRIWGWATIEPTDLPALKYAAATFGNLCLGIDMPAAWQGAKVWDVNPRGRATGDWKPGSWGGHEVPLLAYDPDGGTVITWGAEVRITWEAFTTYVSEVHVVLGPDWCPSQRRPAPNGLDLHALEAALAAV